MPITNRDLLFFNMSCTSSKEGQKEKFSFSNETVEESRFHGYIQTITYYIL